MSDVSGLPRDGARDFEFLHGSWRVHNRRLRQPFADSHDWYEFAGRATERPLWDGQANIEEYEADMPAGRVRGLALRLYNPETRQWTIHWSSSASGTLDQPLTGAFDGNRGTFVGHDTVDGRPILVRFIWSQGGPDSCAWEQAFSTDSGQSWEPNWTMDFTREPVVGGSMPSSAACPRSSVVELRQYTMRPGKRDALIDLFDAEFVEPQEAAGIRVIGEFRNVDDPNKFVWVRGFPNMPARAKSLTEFYDGAIWKSRRDAANATIIDNDNVLLLRPVHPETGFELEPAERPLPGTRGDGPGVVVATIYHLDPTLDKETEFVEFFERAVAPLLTQAGAPVIASFIPEWGANTFPRLPVREGEHVFVWFSRFPSLDAHDRFIAALGALPAWRDSIAVELSSKIREPQTLRLAPSARSLLHG